MKLAILVALAPALALAEEPTPPPAPVPADNKEDLRRRLNNQVEDFDWKERPTVRRGAGPKHARETGMYVGANVAYATMAKVEVAAGSMEGTVDFPGAFAAELQAGYRFLPNLSVALAPQMFFHLAPRKVDAANELGLFAQVTGHVVVAAKWDLNVFAAPGYSVLLVPDAANAHGLAFRWGGGPMFHVSERFSIGGELAHQIGFQKTERNGSDVDMKTSFFSMLVGVRLRR